MGNHTWFYRPIKDNEKATDTCEYSDEVFGENLYTDIDTPHDLFRIGRYQEDKFLSLEDCLSFIEIHKDDMWFDESWLERLKEFWRNNPTGVVEFG